ncbi:hypothetical protein [Crenothrix sp.]|uniref:hypothetical protein n=1 Tax=Crenothrix sp. TaxID=3100433 RepID=UPI00374D46BE
MNQLSKIRAAGFAIREGDDDKVIISPIDELTQQQRVFILANKPAILQQLRIEKALQWLAGIGEEDPLIIAEVTEDTEKLNGLLEYIKHKG